MNEPSASDKLLNEIVDEQTKTIELSGKTKIDDFVVWLDPKEFFLLKSSISPENSEIFSQSYLKFNLLSWGEVSSFRLLGMRIGRSVKGADIAHRVTLHVPSPGIEQAFISGLIVDDKKDPRMEFQKSVSEWAKKESEKEIPMNAFTHDPLSEDGFGLKHDDQKEKYHLLPAKPLHKVVQVLTFGAKKYGEDNWREVPNSKNRYFSAAMRHMWAWWRGERDDSESGLHHLAHAMCCLLFLLAKDDESETSCVDPEEYFGTSNYDPEDPYRYAIPPIIIKPKENFGASSVAGKAHKRAEQLKNDAAKARTMGFGQVGEAFADDLMERSSQEIEKVTDDLAQVSEDVANKELIRKTKESLPPSVIKESGYVDHDVAKLFARISTVVHSAFYASGFRATEVHLGKKEMKILDGYQHMLNLKVIPNKNKHMTIEVR